MPDKIIRQFQTEYGVKKGKSLYYATANAQNRDPETFKKMKRAPGTKRAARS